MEVKQLVHAMAGSPTILKVLIVAGENSTPKRTDKIQMKEWNH